MTSIKAHSKKYTYTQDFNFVFISYKGLEFLIETKKGKCIQTNGACTTDWYEPFKDMCTYLEMPNNGGLEAYLKEISVNPIVFEIDGVPDHRGYTDFLLELINGELFDVIKDSIDLDDDCESYDNSPFQYLGPAYLAPLFGLLEWSDFSRVIDECSDSEYLINFVAFSSVLCVHKDWEPLFSKLIHNRMILPQIRANIIVAYGWDTNFDWSKIFEENNMILNRSVLSFNYSDPFNEKYFKVPEEDGEIFVSDTHVSVFNITGSEMSTPSFKKLLNFINLNGDKQRAITSFKHNIGASDRIQYFNPNGIIDELFK